MSIEALPEENAFELDGLIIKPKVASAGAKASTKPAPRPPVELFARITRRHCALLANERGCDIIIFNHLMIHSVTSFNRPFEAGRLSDQGDRNGPPRPATRAP
jgi:hypothetical protein